MIGSVGPSLEYGGVALIVVVLASLSAEEANISLMRFGLPIFNDRGIAMVQRALDGYVQFMFDHDEARQDAPKISGRAAGDITLR
jgi:hypothetical protein